MSANTRRRTTDHTTSYSTDSVRRSPRRTDDTRTTRRTNADRQTTRRTDTDRQQMCWDTTRTVQRTDNMRTRRTDNTRTTRRTGRPQGVHRNNVSVETLRRRKRIRRRRLLYLRRILIRLLLAAFVVFAAVRTVERIAFQKPSVSAEPLSYRPVQGPPSPDISISAPDTAALPDTAQRIRRENFYTILLAGTDAGNGGSDTIILIGFDAERQAIHALSIPRDTKAIVGGKAHKINAAYKAGGMETLSKTVSGELGIPIDFTMEIDLEGFATLINALGGIEFDVPLNMDYDDPEQNLYIHIPAGKQFLDGETALKVVRFRHNNDGTGYPDQDLGRIATQQKFLKAVAEKLLSPSGVMKLEETARIVQQSVETELTLPNLAWLARSAVGIGPDGLTFSTLPAVWKSPYLYPDKEAVLEILNKHLNPFTQDLRPEDLNFPL